MYDFCVCVCVSVCVSVCLSASALCVYVSVLTYIHRALAEFDVIYFFVFCFLAVAAAKLSELALIS